MKKTGRLPAAGKLKTIMKMLLFSACAAALTFSVISTSPHPFLRVLLSGVGLLALLHELGRRAPVGYQDGQGFHYARPRLRTRRRQPRKNFVFGSLVPSSRPPLSA
jgi:hypothetical protein